MKKKFLIVIFAVLLLTAVSILPVFAASATANVNSVNANRGDTVTLSVTLSQATTVASGAVELTYDKAVLELVKGEWNVSGTMLANFDTAKNKGAFAYTSGTSISGKIFTATFKVKNSAVFGASTVKMDVQLKDGSNAEISVTNNSGKVTVTCKHSYSKWSSVDGNSHTRTCSVCQNKETVKHDFKNACDEKCDTCGYTRTITHSYKDKWSSSSSKHYHECSICKAKKDEASHIPGAAATETTPQTCTVCGYVIKKALGHTHKPTGDWKNDADNHWHECSSCTDKADKAAHVYDNECDESCNVCGYTRTVTHTYVGSWSADKDGHWHVCSGCGAKDEVISHTAGPEATEETPQLCTVCNYEIAPVKAHEHKYEGDYIADADGHHKNCNCGDSGQKEAHTFDNGKVVKEPTADKVGEKHYTCSTCKYVKKVELELVAKEIYETTVEGAGFSIVSMIIGIAVGAVITTGIFLVTKKSRKA